MHFFLIVVVLWPTTYVRVIDNEEQHGVILPRYSYASDDRGLAMSICLCLYVRPSVKRVDCDLSLIHI